jgi:hypothetical protein
MKQVLEVVEAWRERIEEHPLHKWLAEEGDGVAPEQKLWFGAYFINFIMYFRELNHYHIAYAREAGQELFRSALTTHADEDKTHSRLFLKDFKTLDWDSLLGWKPSSVFQWLYSSPLSEGLRRRTSELTKLVIRAQEPVVRFAVVEAIEACGNALFRNTTRVAERIRRQSGRELVYWGHFHLGRETGHVEQENLFHEVVLAPAQRELARECAVRVFELIDEQNTEMLELAQATLAEGGFSARSQRFSLPVADFPTVESPQPLDFHFWPRQPSSSQQPVLEVLARCDNAVRTSERLRFFQYEGLEDAVWKLRALVLYMMTDVTGTDTVYKSMVPYREPQGAQERAINRMARRFGQRSHMLYADWQSLDLDEVLRWKPSRTLEFIYLDKASEASRDMRAVITHHIDLHPEPLLRYWTLLTLKTLTAAHGETFRVLAQRVEEQLGRPLPYFMLRDNPDSPLLSPDAEADAIQFETLDMSPELQQRAIRIVEDVHTAIKNKLEEVVENTRGGRYFPSPRRAKRVATGGKIHGMD